MVNGKRIVVVMPAYNAEKTLERCGFRGKVIAIPKLSRSGFRN